MILALRCAHVPYVRLINEAPCVEAVHTAELHQLS